MARSGERRRSLCVSIKSGELRANPVFSPRFQPHRYFARILSHFHFPHRKPRGKMAFCSFVVVVVVVVASAPYVICSNPFFFLFFFARG